MMIEINISKDFTKTPGARYYSDGPYSGEAFFEEQLRPKFVEAVQKDVKLLINMDGTEGFASSFINEAFRRLGESFGPETVLERLIIISNEIPKYVVKVKESINEGRNK